MASVSTLLPDPLYKNVSTTREGGGQRGTMLQFRVETRVKGSANILIKGIENVC